MDVIIIGGGLSGLYTGWKLQTAGLKCTIIEKSRILGGRIQTKHHRESGVTYESGAGKLLPSHTNMIRLIRTLGFDETDLVLQDKTIKMAMPKSPSPSLKTILSMLKDENPNFLLKQTLKDWMLLHFTQDIVDNVVAQSGYVHVFEDCNAFNAIRYLEEDFVNAKQIMNFTPGLSQIVKALSKAFLESGGVITKKKEVYEIHRVNNNMFKVLNYECRFVILAIPPSNIKNITGVPSDVIKMCDMIEPIPLIRVFGDGNVGPLPYTHTNNVIQRTMQRAQGFYQYVYASASNALFWKRMLDINMFWQALVTHMKKIYPKVGKSESPKTILPYFWKEGVHLWKPGYNGERVWKEHLRSSKSGVYVVGEAFCPYQRWMESALLTSNDVINIITGKQIEEAAPEA